jgi:hypothetical protein
LKALDQLLPLSVVVWAVEEDVWCGVDLRVRVGRAMRAEGADAGSLHCLGEAEPHLSCVGAAQQQTCSGDLLSVVVW